MIGRRKSRLRATARLIACWVAWTTAPLAAEQLPTELRPYRVALSVEFEEGAAFPPAFRDEARAKLFQILKRTVGERWSVTAADVAGTPSALARLEAAAVPVVRLASETESPGLPDEAAPDKFLFASVATDGPRFAVSAREWDRISDTLGPIRTTAASRREEIAGKTAFAVVAAFRPVAFVESADETSATLTVRGGAIPTPDPSVAAMTPETLFTVVMRKVDREGKLTEVRPIPYTYLQVTDADGGTAKAVIRSALRRPLAGRRGRVEAWAVAAPPVSDGTLLRVTRREDGVPLSGRAVEVRSKLPEAGKEEQPAEVSLLTNRDGAVFLAADAARPLLWLTVRSGDATLMRLPLAPGVEPEVTLPLGDDARRLDAESRISIVTGELIETVAKRATLLAKARAAARAGRYEESDRALADVSKLPDVASFRRRLAAVEAPAADAAEKDGDRMAAARIRALGRKAAGLVDRYLNPEVVKTTREEVEELKRTEPDRVPAKS